MQNTLSLLVLVGFSHFHYIIFKGCFVLFAQ